MIYKDFLRNHVVIPGHEGALEKFLKQPKFPHYCNEAGGMTPNWL
jgi:hypothetical protein